MKKARTKVTITSKNSLTLDRGVDLFINNCKCRNLSIHTIKFYENNIHNMFMFFNGKEKVCDLSKNDVDNYIRFLQDSGRVNDVTTNTYVKALRAIFYYFMQEGYITNSFKIQLPKMSEKNIETYSDDELKILLKKPNDNNFVAYRNWTIINFLLGTGCRLNTLINVKVKDIDFKNNTITFTTTKNKKVLLIPLDLTLKKVLNEYITRTNRKPIDYLFCNCYGEKLIKQTLYTSLCTYAKRRGVNKTGIHKFRHTFASTWIKKGGSIATLSKILGHSNIAITDNYIHLLTTDISKNFESYSCLSTITHSNNKIKLSNKK